MSSRYLTLAKKYAKNAGYSDWNDLKIASDNKHKLELNGVKFGALGYSDYIKYKIEGDKDKAEKAREAYLARATKIEGDWKDNKYSANNLSRNLLW